MIFEIKNASFGYEKKFLLENVNFKVSQGEIMSILGSNGAGKTTLIKCSLGLLKWSKGYSLIDGKPLSDYSHSQLWTKIGYVPQAKLSVFSYTVEQMVLLGRSAHLKMFAQPSKDDIKIAHQAMKDIGIFHLKDKMCNRISGGELQMVLIARALSTQPQMLILDEPESNLDFKNQLIILETLKQLCKKRNLSAIINTHYPEHALQLSDKVMLVGKQGEHFFGTADEIMLEENLKQVFDVDVRIRTVNLPEMKYKCVIPMMKNKIIA